MHRMLAGGGVIAPPVFAALRPSGKIGGAWSARAESANRAESGYGTMLDEDQIIPGEVAEWSKAAVC